MTGIKQGPVGGSVSRKSLNIRQTLHVLRTWLACAGRTLLQTAVGCTKWRRMLRQTMRAGGPKWGGSRLISLTIRSVSQSCSRATIASIGGTKIAVR